MLNKHKFDIGDKVKIQSRFPEIYYREKIATVTTIREISNKNFGYWVSFEDMSLGIDVYFGEDDLEFLSSTDKTIKGKYKNTVPFYSLQDVLATLHAKITDVQSKLDLLIEKPVVSTTQVMQEHIVFYPKFSLGETAKLKEGEHIFRKILEIVITTIGPHYRATKIEPDIYYKVTDPNYGYMTVEEDNLEKVDG